MTQKHVIHHDLYIYILSVLNPYTIALCNDEWADQHLSDYLLKFPLFVFFCPVPPTGWNLLIWSRRNVRLLDTWRGHTGTTTAANCSFCVCTPSWTHSSSSWRCWRMRMEAPGSWWLGAADSVSTSTALLLWWVGLVDSSNASFPVVTVGFVLVKTTGADVKA